VRGSPVGTPVIAGPLRDDTVVEVECLGPVSLSPSRLRQLCPEPLVAVTLFVVALAIRTATVGRLSFHVDEQFSVLAAHMVANRGIPLLPSGVPNVHGATLSYLLAPLVRLGRSDLKTLRVVSAVIGALTVVLSYGLARGTFSASAGLHFWQQSRSRSIRTASSEAPTSECTHSCKRSCLPSSGRSSGLCRAGRLRGRRPH
jgi:hypothetical protein